MILDVIARIRYNKKFDEPYQNCPFGPITIGPCLNSSFSSCKPRFNYNVENKKNVTSIITHKAKRETSQLSSQENLAAALF